MIINGTGTSNLLKGTNRADSISGLGGDDRLLGNSGADTIFGGNANDTISGGEGRDQLLGGGGDDLIFGFSGADRSESSGSITIDTIATGLDRPVFACAAPGNDSSLYVIEQHTGSIMIMNAETGAVLSKPFLDIPDAQLSDGNEQGLLGLAFDPAFETNRKFYVYLTNAAGDVEVRSYRQSATNPDVAVASSGNVILTIDKDNGAGNHNGGWMGFGPDSMLYIAVGDEGQGGDPDNNAQDRNELWGKILRIDVRSDDFAADPNRDYAIPDDNPFAGSAGADEIWALGLRNPWRASFDRLTGDFYIGDVGQGDREEINFQEAGSQGGANYGWKVKEGKLVFDGTIPGNPSPTDPSLIDPVVDYGHNADGGFAVVGGYVYRGTTPGMQGRYVYADFITNNLWSFRIVNGKAVDVTEHSAQLTGDAADFQGITSFAEDGNGNLYAIGIDGKIMRLDFGAASGDAADIIDGGSGNDRIFGGAGNDRLSGGTMNDTIYGGAQDDRLDGGTGNDTLRGGAGRDTVNGGAGNDLIVGGRGADTFRFDAAFGGDTISGFQDNIDTIRLADAFGFTSGSQALALGVETAGNVVFTFSGGQTLTVLDTTKAALESDILV